MKPVALEGPLRRWHFDFITYTCSVSRYVILVLACGYSAYESDAKASAPDHWVEPTFLLSLLRFIAFTFSFGEWVPLQLRIERAEELL